MQFSRINSLAGIKRDEVAIALIRRRVTDQTASCVIKESGPRRNCSGNAPHRYLIARMYGFAVKLTDRALTTSHSHLPGSLRKPRPTRGRAPSLNTEWNIARIVVTGIRRIGSRLPRRGPVPRLISNGNGERVDPLRPSAPTFKAANEVSFLSRRRISRRCKSIYIRADVTRFAFNLAELLISRARTRSVPIKLFGVRRNPG